MKTSGRPCMSLTSSFSLTLPNSSTERTRALVDSGQRIDMEEAAIHGEGASRPRTSHSITRIIMRYG